jgi:LuxR family maltose regulon positive regulatory protein
LIASALQSARRVSLAVGPAGIGKSTAVAQWAAGLEVPVAWLSAESSDDVPSVFWRYVDAALERTLSLAPAPLPAGAGNDDVDEAVSVLLARISDECPPVVVVIDDAHHLRRADLLGQLRRFVERSPSNWRFVFIGRARPALPWGRWSSRGELYEIEEDLLRMSQPEAAELVARIAPSDLSAAERDAVIEIAEGWPALIRLTANAVRSGVVSHHALRAAAASDPNLFDFAVGEVLGALPVEMRAVLPALALLDYVDSRRCALLLGVSDGDELLDRLVTSGLPLARLHGVRATYRLHGLLRDLLLAEVTRTRPDDLPALHRRVADVEQRQGNPAAAFRHLIAAGALEEAYNLFWSLLSEAYRSGSRRRGAEWVDLLPPDFIAADAARAAVYSHALLWIGRNDDADRWHRIAEQADRDTSSVAVAVNLALVPVFQAVQAGDTAEAFRQMTELVDRHGTDVRAADSEAMLTTAVAVAALVDERPDARFWVDAIGNRAELPERVRTIAHPTRAAWELFQRGRLVEARHLAQRVLDAGAGEGQAPVHAATELFAVLAMLHLEGLELDDAAYWAQRAVECAEPMDPGLHRWLAASASISVAEARSGPTSALAAIEGWRSAGYPPALDARARLLAAEIEARTGSHTIAARLIEGLDETPRVHLVRARLAVVQNRPFRLEQALGHLEQVPLARRIEADLLRARVEPDGSALDRALTAGAPNGFVWTYLREGPAMLEQLHGVEQRSGRLGRTRLGTHLDAASMFNRRYRTSALPQSLTATEFAVLRQLKAHGPYREIAAELNLSINTVRSHAASILRKLGVNSRSEAVRRAVELGLLE